MSMNKMASAHKPRLGSGARFKAVEKSAAASGAKDAGAVAYSAGVKAHGKATMSRLAAAGKRAKG